MAGDRNTPPVLQGSRVLIKGKRKGLWLELQDTHHSVVYMTKVVCGKGGDREGRWHSSPDS